MRSTTTKAPLPAGADRHPPADPLLAVDHLTVTFRSDHGPVLAVDDVSLRLAAGRSLGVVGESGSGKSVLCRAIMNILAPQATVDPATRIRFGGRHLTELTRSERKHFWGVDLAMVFQDPMTSLTPVLSVGKQIMEPLRYHRGLSRRQAREAALELLRQTGIPDPARRLGQYPHNLSGGMRQRVSIAIALACSPALLLADEPTTALDVTVQLQILNLLQSLQEDRGMAILLVSHDLGVIASRTDDVLVMYAGQVVEQGPTAEVFAAPRHPYTKGLVDSIPKLANPRHSRLHTIPGRLRTRRESTTGCYFAGRCERAQPDCLERTPPLDGAGSAHSFACFHPVGSSAGDEALRRNLEDGRTAAGLTISQRGVG